MVILDTPVTFYRSSMAYRKIHDGFWTDPDIEELTPEKKFFYIYLITNPNVNQLGLYEFSIRKASFEMGYDMNTVEKLLEYFEEIGKIRRSRTTKEIVIIKFYHHNKSNSPKVVKHINDLIQEVKDTSLIQYIYGMHTVSQEEEEEEKKEEEATASAIFQSIKSKYPDTKPDDYLQDIHGQSKERLREIIGIALAKFDYGSANARWYHERLIEQEFSIFRKGRGTVWKMCQDITDLHNRNFIGISSNKSRNDTPAPESKVVGGYWPQ